MFLLQDKRVEFKNVSRPNLRSKECSKDDSHFKDKAVTSSLNDNRDSQIQSKRTKQTIIVLGSFPELLKVTEHSEVRDAFFTKLWRSSIL